MSNTWRILLSLSLLLTHCLLSTEAFHVAQPQRQSSSAASASSTRLCNVLAPDEEGLVGVDEGSGGVRLAEKSVIVLQGTCKYKGGDACDAPELNSLLRYTTLTQVDEAQVDSSSVLGTGFGKETFFEPQEADTEGKVAYAPNEAANDVLAGLSSGSSSNDGVDTVVLNVAGGDGMAVQQVLAALQELIPNLGDAIISKNTKIRVNIANDSSWPEEQASITVVGIANKNNSDESTTSSIDKALANGQLYFLDGKYWTVLEEDLNTDDE